MQTLYDLSPLTRMMWVAVLLTLGPLAWVWWRNRRPGTQGRVQALTLMTLFLTFDLVMFGTFTRLTDSGLGCPDWPGCYGNASPIGADMPIAAAQSAMPTGPVTPGKAWVEMIHRYLATSVGVLIVVLAAIAWFRGGQVSQSLSNKRIGPWWPTLTLFWVCVQGAFGALTVTMKLFPAIVTLHLLGGLVMLAMLCVQWVRSVRLEGGDPPVVMPCALRWLAWFSLALLALQVALGRFPKCTPPFLSPQTTNFSVVSQNLRRKVREHP